ncbi:MAG: hypothetical protein Q9195_001164 [Heterodermia aff. obscurata]
MAQQIDMAECLSYHNTPIVEVVVGGKTEPERIFHIHAGVLIENSEYFKSALQPYFTSGQQRKVCLPEESVEHFSTFARWVYDHSDMNCLYYIDFAKVYVLADRLIAPGLKEDILEAFKGDIEDDLDALISVSERYLDDDEAEKELFRPLEMDQVVEIAKIVYEPQDGYLFVVMVA